MKKAAEPSGAAALILLDFKSLPVLVILAVMGRRIDQVLVLLLLQE
jgi:hypothetical protein